MTAFVCPLLIGRAIETAMLQGLVAAARAGGGSAHAIVGDAGLGKSRLVRTAVDSARQAGAVAALGRCVQGPVAAPLRPLSEAVSTLLRTRPMPQTPTLAPYIPVLGRLAPDLLPPGVDAAAPDPDPVHLGEGLLRLMRVYADGGGSLLVVEDLHAADSLTLAVLEYLADALAAPAHELGLSLLLTLRPQPSPGPDLVAALQRRRSLQSTVLSPLADGEVAELVRACAADLPEPVVQVVVDRADGIPFLAEELLAAAADDLGQIDLVRVADVVPLSLADAVRRRCAALTPPVRELLMLAAVVGRSTDPALLAAATGTGADEVVAALNPARAAQLLAEDEPCTFRHALTREALLAGVLPAQRVPLARRLLLASAPAGADAAVVAELAEAAGEDDAAARAWLRVADHAITRGLPNGAEAALERAGTRAAAARDPHLRAAVAHRRLATLALAGRADDVLRLSGQLQTSTHLDSDALQELHLHAARAALDAGLLDRAERELAGCDESNPEVLSLGALVALAGGRLGEAQHRAQAVLDLAASPAAATCEAWEVFGRLRRPQDLRGAAAAFAAAHDAARAAGLALWEVRALHELGTVEMFLSGRADRLEQAHAAATALGALTTRAVLDVQIASCHALALEPAAALDRAAAAAAVAERTGARPLGAAAAVIAAQAHAYAGRWADAGREAGRARALSDDDPETLALLAGMVDGLGGLFAEDRRRASRGFDVLARLAVRAPRLPPTPAHSFRVLVGALEQAPWAAQAGADADAAGLATAPYNAFILACADAVDLGRRGRLVAADQCVREAETALQAVAPAPAVQRLASLARRLMAEAALRDGWGEPVAWLRAVMVELDEHTPAVAAASRRLLRDAGQRAPRRSAAALVPLPLRALGVTAREHEVLLLVAAGATNREVAERLHLSPRTVETHVARLLAKTGASGRAALADWVTSR